ncbi:YhcN/YlaJ family sporulation lipoprotein [Ferroacidibacillus organovorans]|uniref:Sporulation protein n=1 Tax=Ferroacidibacillus organovorans TaxID=1765683 RepID=A0A162TSH3_9BACL|nr:YhcN/YlaJ family sporulation lipoprotein [Ferroacidibacillus organovorans]KYP81084.1 hypothetical protein AYJ22_08750 [Ferroacidibacillus organovorans]OAG93786.1 hypothetical protein AYW79_08715 [Ferroacidibacillus organovorans]OPG17391.1 hypothetical protein B2M26_01245 [Ferroacidibacillus organovorans]
MRPLRFRLHRRINAFAVLTFTLISCSGFAFVRDREPDKSHVHINDSNALQNATVKKTAFHPRLDLGKAITAQIPNVSFATVLQRKDDLYVGIATRDGKNLTPLLEHQIMTTVQSAVPSAQHILISTDKTLVNHFQIFSSSFKNGSTSGSDLIISDVERVFPQLK